MVDARIQLIFEWIYVDRDTFRTRIHFAVADTNKHGFVFESIKNRGNLRSRWNNLKILTY